MIGSPSLRAAGRALSPLRSRTGPILLPPAFCRNSVSHARSRGVSGLAQAAASSRWQPAIGLGPPSKSGSAKYQTRSIPTSHLPLPTSAGLSAQRGNAGPQACGPGIPPPPRSHPDWQARVGRPRARRRGRPGRAPNSERPTTPPAPALLPLLPRTPPPPGGRWNAGSRRRPASGPPPAPGR